MDEREDQELLHRCAAGDVEAFGRLFDLYVDDVYRYAFRRTGSWSDAEDLVSITFIEAWKKRGALRIQKTTILPWLLGVATNADRNLQRSKRRYAALLRRLSQPDLVPDPSESVAGRLDAEIEAKAVLKAIDALDERDRDVAIICLADAHTYEQAAQILGIPVGTVKSRINRVRKILSEVRLNES